MNEKHWVYKVVIDGVIRYVGYTNDIVRREKQHNYLLKKGKNKLLYNNIRIIDKETNIKLITIKTFQNHVEAKRYECLLILIDYFKDKQLWQKVPQIKDL